MERVKAGGECEEGVVGGVERLFRFECGSWLLKYLGL